MRYAVVAEPGDVADYCHCGQCRKASGTPVTAWIQVPPSRFEVTQGQAKAFASSARATRWFCGDCGAPLYMTDPEGRSVGVTLGTLDDPNAVRPTVHGWFSARVAWLKIQDPLPRHAEDPPYDL
ncbi:MAG: GFA family protein [Caulobacteraceae bacterium]|nr:GFA family protein [Caulobacteraceae bacterium]